MPDRRLAVEAWESLFRAQHEVFEDIKRDFADSSLQQGEYDVLLSVVRGTDGTARLRDITENMLISQPSVSRLVDKMVSRGLVTKCSDPEDGRGALVTATEAGTRTFRMLAVEHGRHIAARMSSLTNDELRTLTALTQKLRA
ncbi:MarR family winged helix-turn-helix transcriptional regulator [Microbacterium karelineae]|uniref:MarR family winged helix-turn-helix transcriptional regulator n=1 Tax=Microbacterium karelineae TaxID=2654283 RepID=UPI0012EAB43A|nr:MarR family transcriptional regulator [Microbacterium karelineae]